MIVLFRYDIISIGCASVSRVLLPVDHKDFIYIAISVYCAPSWHYFLVDRDLDMVGIIGIVLSSVICKRGINVFHRLSFCKLKWKKE